MNENWNRWILASLNVYFNSQKGSDFLLIEGIKESNLPTDRLELRINGPSFVEIVKDCWSVHVDINILIRTKPDTIYEHTDRIGLVQKMFATNIMTTKTGNVSDTGDDFTCLIRENDLITDDFGRTNEPNNLLFTTVEATYKGEINWP